MKFSKLFGSLLFILAMPLVLLADGIKFDHLAERTLLTNQHGHAFFSDADEEFLTASRNLKSSLSNFVCASADGSDIDNDVRHAREHGKADGINRKWRASLNQAKCDGEQSGPDPVSITLPIDRHNFVFDTPSTPVPEPASLVLLGAGLFALVAGFRRKLLDR
jgi:hypothetical protein